MPRARHFVLLVSLLFPAPPGLVAQSGILSRPDVQVLRQEYQEQLGAIQARRREELQALLTKQLESQRLQLRQATITGNTSRQVDATQGVKLFEAALAALAAEDTFRFPERIRPALTRMVELCTRALQSEDATREASIKRLEGRFADRLQPLLAAQGERIVDPDRLRERWREVLLQDPTETDAAAADDVATAAPGQATPAASGQGARPDTANDVLAARGEAANWVPLARIGVDVHAMEILALPVLDLTERIERKGEGLESGAPWQAAVTPFRTLSLPGGVLPAMRIRALPERRPVDVVDWPSPRNRWMLEIRVRPPHAGASRHGVIVEIDAAADAVPLQDQEGNERRGRLE